MYRIFYNKKSLLGFFEILSSVSLGFFLVGILLAVMGQNPFFLYTKLFVGGFGNLVSILWSLTYSTPIILAGLGVAVALRAGLFNIGADGQYIVGTIAAVWIGYRVSLPMWIHVPTTLVAGMVAGMLWSSIAGYLRAWWDVNEVFVTIMLNWIALYASNLFTLIPGIKSTQGEISHDVQMTARIIVNSLSRIMGCISCVNIGIIVASFAVFIVHVFLNSTVLGFKLRVVGLNETVALASGISVARTRFIAMLISGALTGLSGAVHIISFRKHTSVLLFSEGYGFDGLFASLVGKGNPLAIMIVSFFYGSFKYSSRKLTGQGISSEFMQIVMAFTLYLLPLRFVLKDVGKRLSALRYRKA